MFGSFIFASDFDCLQDIALLSRPPLLCYTQCMISLVLNWEALGRTNLHTRPSRLCRGVWRDRLFHSLSCAPSKVGRKLSSKNRPFPLDPSWFTGAKASFSELHVYCLVSRSSIKLGWCRRRSISMAETPIELFHAAHSKSRVCPHNRKSRGKGRSSRESQKPITRLAKSELAKYGPSPWMSTLNVAMRRIRYQHFTYGA